MDLDARGEGVEGNATDAPVLYPGLECGSSYTMSEGQKGGEFFTPLSIVKLIVEIIEPFHRRIYDSASGSVGH